MGGSLILMSHATFGGTLKSQLLAYTFAWGKPTQSPLLMIHTIMYTYGHVRMNKYT